MKNNDTKRISSQVMELKELIAGPLLATIDADSLSARRYLDYLMQLAFESYDPQTGVTGPLRMLTFSYAASGFDAPQMQQVRIPLLTLVPLPLLQVKEADFDFDIQILDAFTEQAGETFSLKEGCLMPPEPSDRRSDDVRLRVVLAPGASGECSATNVRQALTANMKVRVKMQQADMPGGLSRLLNMTTNNVMIENQ